MLARSEITATNILCYISYFCIVFPKSTQENYVKEERFILAHNIPGFSHQLLGSKNFGNTLWSQEYMENLMADRIQIKKNRVVMWGTPL